MRLHFDKAIIMNSPCNILTMTLSILHPNQSFNLILTIALKYGVVSERVNATSSEVKLSDSQTKEYIGMAANSFRDRYNKHKKSFNLIKHEKEYKLSKYIS